MTRLTRVAPLLLRGRIKAGQGLIDLMSLAAFTLSSWMLLTVLAGVNAFWARQVTPPQPFLDALGSAAEFGTMELPIWTLLAGCAGVLLVTPVMTLGAAAARMGALGRDSRLATLRLLGVTGGQAIGLSTLETMLNALAGAILGLALYLVTLPAWSAIVFQATPLSAGEMLLPAWGIAATLALIVALAGLSSVAGLLRLRISPLGVARRQPRPGLKLWRLAAVPVAVIAWTVIAPTVNLAQEVAIASAIIVVALGLFMGVINLVGPWLLQAIGHLLARSPRPAALLAGRRLLAEPKAAWRSVSGLAFVGFTGGALSALPDFSALTDDPLIGMLAADLRTGTYLTLAIAFLVAAASTLLNQASSVLDRRGELKQLDNLGVPLTLHDRTRLVEVVAPAALAALGSGLFAVFFFGLVPAVAINPVGMVAFVAALVAGVALVWAAAEACRPLLRSVVTTTTVRAD